MQPPNGQGYIAVTLLSAVRYATIGFLAGVVAGMALVTTFATPLPLAPLAPHFPKAEGFVSLCAPGGRWVGFGTPGLSVSRGYPAGTGECR
jgi:hypothetical protein